MTAYCLQLHDLYISTHIVFERFFDHKIGVRVACMEEHVIEDGRLNCLRLNTVRTEYIGLAIKEWPFFIWEKKTAFQSDSSNNYDVHAVSFYDLFPSSPQFFNSVWQENFRFNLASFPYAL